MGDLLSSFDYGLNAPAGEFDGINQYLRITDIDDHSREFLKSNLTSPKINLSGLDEYLLKNGDILFARTGASVGKSFIYREEEGKTYFAGFLIRGIPKANIDSDFVFQNTLTPAYMAYIRIISQRSGQPGVNAKEYEAYPIAVPEYREQVMIGDFLSQFDNLSTLHQR